MIDLKQIEFPKSLEYRSESDFEPFEFFLDGLANSNHFDLLLGYFTSSAINTLSVGFASFIANGGHLRMIINNVLTPQDKQAINLGEGADPQDFGLSLDRLDQIIANLSLSGEHFFKCFAYLISEQRIKIKAIVPDSRRGISHYKSGYFSDGKNQMSFKGSCNFTASALLENLEELYVRLSWNSENDSDAIGDYQDYFEQIFNGKLPGIKYIPTYAIEERIVDEFGAHSLEDLLMNEFRLLEKFNSKIEASDRIKNKILNYRIKAKKTIDSPKFPFESGPRDYQIKAFQAWKENSYNGIFAMATGTGKTITALNCALEIFRSIAHYKIIILVPSLALISQWENECRSFKFNTIIKIGSNTNFSEQLNHIITSSNFNKQSSFVIICTYQSFIKAEIHNRLNRLPDDTLLIADEAHNLGANKLQKLLPSIKFHMKIGLSATPKRIYDSSGTTNIEDFFNDAEPYTYTYSLEQAIDNEILCKYYYYPFIVELTSIEIEKYFEISKKLARIFNANESSLPRNDIVTALLLQRKRIIHKAYNKLEAFKASLRKHLNEYGHLNYSLIYAPEGFTSNEIDDDELEEDRLINYYNKAVLEICPDIFIESYTSNSSNRENILRNFEEGKTNVLSSMKCLDEGVDIPRTQNAFFCSSTGNPRQFIQRRGRILRKHYEKDFANIYDLIVVPPTIHNSESNFELERSLLRKELERVAYFSFISMNFFDTYKTFENICSIFNLNLYEISETLK